MSYKGHYLTLFTLYTWVGLDFRSSLALDCHQTIMNTLALSKQAEHHPLFIPLISFQGTYVTLFLTAIYSMIYPKNVEGIISRMDGLSRKPIGIELKFSRVLILGSLRPISKE